MVLVVPLMKLKIYMMERLAMRQGLICMTVQMIVLLHQIHVRDTTIIQLMDKLKSKRICRGWPKIILKHTFRMHIPMIQ